MITADFGLVLVFINFLLAVYVSFLNHYSSQLKIFCAVQQGCILGSLLFLIYVNDPANVSSVLFTLLFVDNTAVSIHLHMGRILSRLVISRSWVFVWIVNQLGIIIFNLSEKKDIKSFRCSALSQNMVLKMTQRWLCRNVLSTLISYIVLHWCLGRYE